VVDPALVLPAVLDDDEPGFTLRTNPDPDVVDVLPLVLVVPLVPVAPGVALDDSRSMQPVTVM